MAVICPIQDHGLDAPWTQKYVLCQTFIKKHHRIDSKKPKITTYSQKITKINLYIVFL